MNKIKIIDGLEITDISLGAGARGTSEDANATQFRVMDRYLDWGGNCFDTARMYANGMSDVVLGRYITFRKNRSRVILCTKGNHPQDRNAMHISRLTPADITQDLEESLKALETDYSDLHLLHRDDPNIPVEQIMPALHALVKSGKARAIGVSNWTVGRIAEANEFAARNGLTPLSVSQLHYSLLQTSAAQTRDLTHVPMNSYEFEWYRQNDFPVMAFGSQGRGYISRLIRHEEQKPGPMLYYGHYPENRNRSKRLLALACEIGGKSLASVALAYVRDNALRASVLCAFSSVDQLDEAFQATFFTLSPDEIRFLETGTRPDETKNFPAR